MKTTIGALKLAIKKALKAVDTASCAIQANGRLSVIGSSAQGSIRIDVPVEGTVTKCAATISAKQVGAILGGIDDAVTCTIKAAQEGIILSFGGSRIKLTQPYEDVVSDMFETTLKGERLTVFATTGKRLADLMAGPVDFASKHDIRYYLVGVEAMQDDGVLRVTGTNGTKLCTAASDIAASAQMQSCIIPRNVAEAIGVVFGADEAFEFQQIGDAQNMRMFLGNEKIQWISSAIAGRYPDWKRIMPNPKRMGSVELSRDGFVSAVLRVQAASGEVYAKMIFSKEGVQIASPDGEQRETFPAQVALESPIQIGFQSKLLAEAVEAVETPTFMLALDGNDAASKFVITPVSAKIDNWIGICMPARV